MSLDEFVASFQALIPQDTPGWAVASSSISIAAQGKRGGSVGAVRKGLLSFSPATVN